MSHSISNSIFSASDYHGSSTDWSSRLEPTYEKHPDLSLLLKIEYVGFLQYMQDTINHGSMHIDTSLRNNGFTWIYSSNSSRLSARRIIFTYNTNKPLTIEGVVETTYDNKPTTNHPFIIKEENALMMYQEVRTWCDFYHYCEVPVSYSNDDRIERISNLLHDLKEHDKDWDAASRNSEYEDCEVLLDDIMNDFNRCLNQMSVLIDDMRLMR